ncbi:MAG: autotransporter-associated beta strand repeat-containing protein [Planctomycetia bacterium]|nr:autotransporter-associated beta strand repeat-containing protein [Planctomycetia bacterium]
MKKCFFLLWGCLGCGILGAADVTITKDNSPYTMTSNIDALTFDNTDNYTGGVLQYVTDNPSSEQKRTISGNITGTGTIIRQANTSTNDRGSWLSLSGNNSGFSGNVNISGNTWVALTTATAGSAKAAWNLNMTSDSGLLFENVVTNDSSTSATIQLGDLTGNGMVRPGNGNGKITLEIGALGNNSTFSGTLKNQGSVTVAVTKVGTGTWTLSGANSTLFTGGLNVTSGRVILGTGAALQSTTISITGGTLEMTSASNIPATVTIPIDENGTLAVNGTGTFNMQNTLTGAGTLEVLNGNYFLLRGNNTAFTGTLKLTGGITSVDTPATQVGSAKIQFNGGTLRTYDTYSNAIDVTERGGTWHIVASDSTMTGTITGSGILTVSRESRADSIDKKLIFNGDASAWTGGFNITTGHLSIGQNATLRSGQVFQLASTATLEFVRTNDIEYTVNLTAEKGSSLINGNNRVTLRGTVAGDITFDGGAFSLGADNVSGLKSITLNNGTRLVNWGSNRFGTATLDINDGTLVLRSSQTYANAINVGSSGTFEVNLQDGGGSNTPVLSGKISGTDTSVLNKTGSETLSLTGNNDDYKGTWQVSNGTLNLGAANVVASSAAIVNNAAITFATDQTLNNLSGSGTITGTSGTLTLRNSIDTTYTGTINANSVLFQSAENSTAKLTLDTLTTEKLDLFLNVNDTATGNLTLSAFDPDITNLSVTLNLLEGVEYNPSMIFPVLTVTDGTLDTGFNWQSVLSEWNGDDWFLYLNNDATSLLAGVNGAKYPEPGSFWLLLLGFLGIFRTFRKSTPLYRNKY